MIGATDHVDRFEMFAISLSIAAKNDHRIDVVIAGTP
jgi:hypothetical protein